MADELKRADLLEASGGTGNLIALQANTPAIANAARYARIVEEHALLRRLIGVAGEIAEMGYSLPEDVVATMDRAEAMVFEVVERRVTDSLKPSASSWLRALTTSKLCTTGGTPSPACQPGTTTWTNGFQDCSRALS